MKFVKKHWLKIAILALLVLGVVRVMNFYKNKNKPVPEEKNIKLVDLHSLVNQGGGFIDTLCKVEPQQDTKLLAEVSAEVEKVFVNNGDEVKIGQKIAQLKNIQQRIAVENARVSYTSAKLSLDELVEDNDTANSASVLEQTKKSQELSVQNAYNAYLNTDLRAYPEDYDETTPAPIISGNYRCEAEGVYELEVYSSSADSGASFRVKGLETGRNSATLDYAVPLAECGLEILFPADFNKNKTWTIPVPNTRSSSHFMAKNAYESAKNGKDLSLNQTEVSPQQLAQARARVNQAALSLESARDNLEKTIIRAKNNGTLASFDLEVGDFVNVGQELGEVSSLGDLKLVSYIPAEEKEFVSFGAKVVLTEGKEAKVALISPSIDSKTKKIKLDLSLDDSTGLISGTESSCQVARQTISLDDSDELVIPLSAVSVVGLDYYIYSIDENSRALAHKIIPGAILGKNIVIDSIDVESIVKDARGVREGQEVYLEK